VGSLPPLDVRASVPEIRALLETVLPRPEWNPRAALDWLRDQQHRKDAARLAHGRRWLREHPGGPGAGCMALPSTSRLSGGTWPRPALALVPPRPRSVLSPRPERAGPGRWQVSQVPRRFHTRMTLTRPGLHSMVIVAGLCLCLCLCVLSLTACGTGAPSAGQGAGTEVSSPVPPAQQPAAPAPEDANLAGLHACKLVPDDVVARILGELAGPPVEYPDGLTCAYHDVVTGDSGGRIDEYLMTVLTGSRYEMHRSFLEGMALHGAPRVVAVPGLGDDAYARPGVEGAGYDLAARKGGLAIELHTVMGQPREDRARALMAAALAGR
jgi:hypothetical protein